MIAVFKTGESFSFGPRCRLRSRSLCRNADRSALRAGRFGLTRLRAGGGDDPDVFVFGLPHGRRSRAPLGPAASQRPLLAEATFILEEHDDLPIGMLGLKPSQLFGNFFGNAAIASGSFFRCFGRGTSHS